MRRGSDAKAQSQFSANNYNACVQVSKATHAPEAAKACKHLVEQWRKLVEAPTAAGKYGAVQCVYVVCMFV